MNLLFSPISYLKVIGASVLTVKAVNLLPFTTYGVRVAGVADDGTLGDKSQSITATTHEGCESMLERLRGI